MRQKSEKEKSDRGSDQTVLSGWKTRSVLVVPVSRNGELAKNIREVERRMNVITDYKTKIIESVGKKLKDLMSNKNPWSGQECGRGECVPCGQAGDRKINCTQRNLVYESKCMDCNQVEEKGRKKGSELEDTRDEPSIYVGETARSLAERSAEHWKDFESRDTDSHMLKHWMIHHKGEGRPNFKFEVVKFCKDALSRQVGEAVRISFRKNCLNSKAGYNRCGLTRLTIQEEDEELLAGWKTREDQGTEETTSHLEERGVEAMVKKIHEKARQYKERKRKRDLDGGPTIGKEVRHKSKGKKLRYEKLDSTWGLDLNEMERLEEHELARNRFLNSGPGLCKIGEGWKQATIRVWSAREVFARDIMKNCFDTACMGSDYE